MKKSILAIDGSKAIRFLLQTVLGNEYNVVTAADGTSAIYWLSKRKMPDVIVIDPELADMADWGMIEYLSTSGLYNEIPVIILADLEKKELQQRCHDMDLKYYFTKPFNPVELVKMVNHITEKKHAPREAVLKAL